MFAEFSEKTMFFSGALWTVLPIYLTNGGSFGLYFDLSGIRSTVSELPGNCRLS